MQPPGSLEFSI